MQPLYNHEYQFPQLDEKTNPLLNMTTTYSVTSSISDSVSRLMFYNGFVARKYKALIH